MRPKLILFGFILLALAPPAGAYTFQDYYNAGMQFYQQKQYGQAIAYLKEAVVLDPQSWQTYQVLGMAYYQNADQADAVSAAHTSLKINPDNPALQKFVDQLNPNASMPLTAAGMSVKPIVSPGLKAGHIFFDLGIPFEEPFGGSLSASEKNYKANSPSGPNYSNSNDYEPAVFGFNFELGYDLDQDNGLSLELYAPGGDSGPYLDYQTYNNTNGDGASQYIDAQVSSFGIRYYRYLPDPLGRWFGFAGVDIYSLSIEYSQTSGSGIDPGPTMSAGTVARQLTGSTVGGILGLGHQFDIFGFLGLEVSLSVKYADVPRVTGPYTSSSYNNNSLTSTSKGTGTLITLSNGSVVMVDQKNVGNSKIADIDLSGLQGRAVFNFWF